MHITQSSTRARTSHEQWIDPYAENTENIDPDHLALDITLERTVFQTYGHTRKKHAHNTTTQPLPPSLPSLITLIPPRPVLPLTPENARLSALKQLTQSFPMFTERFTSNRAQLTGNIYTDGSVNTSRTRGGYAIVIELTHDLQRPVATGAYDGPTISSSALEAITVYHTIALYPPNKSLTIFTDSKNVVINFTRIQVLKHDYLIRKRRKLKRPTHWAAMLHLIVNRPSPVMVTCVKGHSDNTMNNHADLHAGIACNDPDLPVWHLFDLYHTDTKFHFEIDNVQCLDHTPHPIKSMFNFVHSKQWNLKMREHFLQLRHYEVPPLLLKPHTRLNSKFFPDDLPTYDSAMSTPPAYLKKNSTSLTPTLDTRIIQLMSPLCIHNRRIRNADTDTQRQSHRTKKLMKRVFTHDLGYALGSPFPNPYYKYCIDLQSPAVETQKHI